MINLLNRLPKNRLWFFLIAGLFVSVFADNLQAQSIDRGFRHFTPQDGFPSYAYRLEPGPRGYIWITGPHGLAKFDGYDVTYFQHDPSDEYSVPEGLIFNVMTDDRDNLWLTNSSGIYLLDPWTEQFRTVILPDSIPAITFADPIIQSSNGYIWIVDSKGLYRFTSPTTNKPAPEVRYYPSEIDEDEDLRFRNLAERDEQRIWLTSTRGLYEFNLNTEKYTKINLPDNIETTYKLDRSSYILRDQDGNLWMGREGALVVFGNESDSPAVLTSLGNGGFDLTDKRFTTLNKGSNKSIYIGLYGEGFLQYYPDTDEYIQYATNEVYQNGLAEDITYNIKEDTDGNIWVGHSSNGMTMIYEKSWTYTFHQISPEEFTNRVITVSAFQEDHNNNLWMSTNYGLLKVPADGGSIKSFLPEPGADPSEVTSNYIENLDLYENTLFISEWAGDRKSNFYAFDIESEKFELIDIPDSLKSYEEQVSTGSSIYWTAKGSSQLVEFIKSDRSIGSYSLPFKYPIDKRVSDSMVVISPIIDASDELYIKYSNINRTNTFVSSDWSHYSFDEVRKTFSEISINFTEDFRTYSFKNSAIPSNTEEGVIYTLAIDGILQEDLINKSYSFFPLAIKSTDLWFGSGLQATDGAIWFSDLAGTLRKLDPESETVESYPLDLNRKPMFISANYERENGNLIFGGSGGYIEYHPGDVRTVTEIQKVYITEFQAGSNTTPILKYDEKFEIDFANNNISFSYLGINYRSPDTRYRYRLLGYNDDWVDLNTQRSIFFANLPFGNYTFQVQATKPGTSFSEESASTKLDFTILPPWWRTIPAYLSYLLLFGGFIFGADRFQRKRLLQKERERATAKELEQAKEIEKAYENLKQAQEQLVQQEKLASLGQLTAGIAHEIKNPLNFVNNFSDLSSELVEELIEAMKKGDLDEAEGLAVHIDQNLKKIHEHGSRADSIVKSMLEHSRGGDGLLEPTNLNALVKEYVNLSFHGMRAGKDPINVDIYYELDENIDEVPLIAEDFSRVIVNLANNAFDAMRTKLTEDGGPETDGYSPKLTVRTAKEKDNVLIEIKDNGPGIPEEIKDQILQPFFTTKKGTEGTGLGLSITNDIIKAHGGFIEVSTEQNEGTSFTIKIS